MRRTRARPSIPRVLFVGGNGKSEFSPKGTQVTAKVVGSALGEKIRIGKYKKRTGYRRHTGHRAQLTQIEITAIGAGRAAAQSEPEAQAEEAAAKKPAAKDGPEGEGSGQAEALAKPNPAAKAEPKPKAAPKPKAEPEEGAE